MNLLEQSELLTNILTGIAIVIGGFWTYWKFIRQGDGRPKVIFELDLRVINKVQQSWIVELICTFENKGLVRHKISAKSFVYNLRFLKSDDPIKNGFQKEKEFYNQLFFPHEFLINYKSSLCWLPSDWDYTFIEAGTRQKYSCVVAIPDNVSIILFHSKFAYDNSPDEFHTADAVFKV